MKHIPQRSPITCCHRCAERAPGCHSSCPRYLAEKAAHEAELERHRAERAREVDYQQYRRAAAARIARDAAPRRRRNRK